MSMKIDFDIQSLSFDDGKYTNRTINSNNFLIIKNRFQRNDTLSFEYVRENLEYDNYYIYKSTGKQRKVTKDDVYNMKYAGFIFFHKDLYDIDFIEEWIEFFNTKIYLQYLSKALPPFGCDKIKIKL